MKANENHPGALRGRGSAVPKVLVIERHLAVSDVLSMALKPRYDVHPLLVEPAATRNTGNVEHPTLTAPVGVRV